MEPGLGKPSGSAALWQQAVGRAEKSPEDAAERHTGPAAARRPGCELAGFTRFCLVFAQSLTLSAPAALRKPGEKLQKLKMATKSTRKAGEEGGR